jgi:hypothetical protein
MDTRFWGPSGWRLLHLVAVAAPDLDEANLYTFFSTLPYVLPCKFCRASLSDYIQNDPVPIKKADYAHWLYRIHNRVNAKLREQRLHVAPDPLWSEVKSHYKTMYNSQCTQNMFLGWDFLYSTAYVTPCPAVQSSPMPDAPPIATITTPELRNRWGLMSRNERLPYLEKWWDSLAVVLPFQTWQEAWKNGSQRPHTKFGRGPITRWLYKMEAHLCNKLQAQKHHDNYQAVCNKLSTFSSNCGKHRVKVKTCRAKRVTRKTLKLRQAGRFL